MNKFADYIKLNEAFIPVYTQENDSARSDAWKSFIPQASMRDILRDLIKMLDGAKAADRKSLWITGSYGTGKTYAAFVIKHLLEDSLEKIAPWFERHPVLHDLWEQFRGLRERKRLLVPVFRSSSSSIRDDNRLFMEIQRGIREALRERGLNYMGGHSLYEQVIEKTCSPDSSFNFKNAFRNHCHVFEGYQTSAEEVLSELRDNPNDSILLGKALEVLELEGQYLESSVDKIKDWIKDVIDGNQIDAIVFIWDEFTDYFRNNASVSALQEISHSAYGNTPFYFVLVTHRRMEQFGQLDSDARKTLQARFFIHNLTLSDITAYKLMANALEYNTALETQWETVRSSLWDAVLPVFSLLQSEMRGYLDEYCERDFINLIPLHPYSAYLLTHLSAQFSANQRTMFSFLQAQGGTEERPDFCWFINQHGPASEWKWLTSDYLWDYFLVQDSFESNDGAQERVSYYLNNVSRVDGNRRRIFKAAMLLLVLELRASGVKLLQPFLSNLEMMFRGTDLTPSRIKRILTEDLEKQGLLQLTELARGQWQISLPMLHVDRERLAKIKELKAREWTFERNTIDSSVLHNAVTSMATISSPNRTAERYLLRCATHSNASGVLADLATKTRPNQIGVLVLLAHEAADVGQSRRFIEQKITQPEYQNIAFVQITYAFGAENWERWQEAKAREAYALERHDRANSQVYADRATKLITDWLMHVRISRNCIFYRGHEAQFGSNFWENLDIFASETFPAGMERLSQKDDLYDTAISIKAAQLGLGQRVSAGVRGRFDALIRAMKKEGIWDNLIALDAKPDHPLARARQMVAQLLATSSSRAVKFKDIWDALQAEPFGYLRVRFTCFLLGYLFREYVGKGYYLNDGRNTSVMSIEGIAVAVENLLKGKGDFYSISQMKQEHILLCNQCSRIFHLDSEKGSTLQEMRKHVREVIADYRYPLWVAAYGEHIPSYQRDFFNEMSTFLSEEGEAQQLACADRLCKILDENPGLVNEANVMMKPDRFTDGMDKYLRQHAPETVAYTLDKNYGMDKVRNVVRERISESGFWLWDKQRLDQEIERIEQETSLVRLLAQLTSQPVVTLEEAKSSLKSQLEQLRIPASLLAKKSQPLADLIIRLWRLANSQGTIDESSDFERQLEGSIATIQTLMADESEILRAGLSERTGFDFTLEAVTNELISKLPSGCLDMDERTYWVHVDQIAARMQIAGLHRELRASWMRVSGYESPKECSTALTFPVAWLPAMRSTEARVLTTALDGTTPLRTDDYDRLQQWITVNGESLKAQINDRELHEQLWLEEMVGDYSVMISEELTLSELISQIPRKFGDDVHAWGDKRMEIRDLIQQLMSYYYGRTGKVRVLQRIEQLSERECKLYLKALIENNESVGLAILKDGQ